MMAAKFKVNDLVEIINLNLMNNVDSKIDINKNWIIVGIASNGGEAIILHLFQKLQTTIKVEDLKHQKKEDK